jgi:hypothetical protein
MKTVIKVAEKKQKTYSGIVNNLRYDSVDDIEDDDIEENLNEKNNMIDLNENPLIIDAIEKVKENKQIIPNKKRIISVIELFEKVKLHYENKGSAQSYNYIASKAKRIIDQLFCFPRI